MRGKRYLLGVMLVAAAIPGTVGVVRAATNESSRVSGVSGAKLRAGVAEPHVEEPASAGELSLAEVKAIALEEAKRSRESGETALSIARGGFGAAELAIFDISDREPPGSGLPEAASTEPVFVVVMRGHFRAWGPVPPGEPAPTGTVLTLVIVAHGGFVAERYLGSAGPDLETVGPVVELDAAGD